jgi:small subunit ribosomal protein S8e
VVTRKTRVLDVVYNASNNELVRTKTLVKNAVIVIDATPFRQWYEQHYSVQMVKKGAKFEVNVVQPEKRGKSAQATYKRRQEERKLDPKLLEQFATGRLLACVSSRPGQCGRCDGYVLEGKELEFYQKKILIKKKGKA